MLLLKCTGLVLLHAFTEAGNAVTILTVSTALLCGLGRASSAALHKLLSVSVTVNIGGGGLFLGDVESVDMSTASG